MDTPRWLPTLDRVVGAMIPNKMVDFVHGPVVMFLGTRSAELRPSFSWVFVAVARGEEGTITVLAPDVEGEQSFRNLEDNGRVALTVAEGITHESYQFKGRFIDMRPSAADERAIQDIHNQELATHYAQLGFAPELFGDFATAPSTAVSFKVEEVFVQTLGPGAGEKVETAEATG